MGLVGRLLEVVEHAIAPGWRFRRSMRRVPTLSLGTLAESTLGRITGRVHEHERALVAPLTGRACVYYSVTIIAVDSLTNGPKHRRLGSVQDAVSFELDDGSGVALVEPAGAEFAVAFDRESSCRGMFDADAMQRQVFARACPDRVDWFQVSRVLFREAVIAPGATLTLSGAAMLEPDRTAPAARDGPLFRAGPAMRLRFTGSDTYPLVLSDDPRVR